MVDARIPLMAQGIDGLKMLENSSKIADQWLTDKTDGELSRIYSESQGDLNKMLELGQQSKMARWVMPQLQQQQAAQQKTALDTQKTQADIFATKGKGTKDFADAGGTTQKISENQLSSARRAIIAGAQNGNPQYIKMGLNEALTAGAIDQATYTQFNTQLDGFGNDPAKISEWAKNAVLAGSQNPESFLFQTANNAADNIQSERNSVRTAETSRYGTDVGANTADKNRVQQGEQFGQSMAFNEQKLRIDQDKGELVTGADGKGYIFYPGKGKYEPAIDAQGQHLSMSGSKGMSEQQSKDALFGARMQEANKMLATLESDGISAPVLSHAGSYGEAYAQVMPGILGGASSQQQQYMQAQRDFINATLRKESGAAIAESEFDNARKQYFPQVGDSKAVIAQKAQNRTLALNMIIQGSGRMGQENIQKATQKEQGIPYANAGQQKESNSGQKAIDSIASKYGF